MGMLWGNTVDKAIDSVAGTSLADNDEPMEDQPTDQEIIISELRTLLHHKDTLLANANVPQKVGLVEPFIFDPQANFDLLTELFGVYKEMAKVYHYECRECWHEWTSSTRLDGDDTYACPSCGDDSNDGDGLFDFTRDEVMTSREPTPMELSLVYAGNDTRADSPWFVRSARQNLAGHFAQLNGHESDEIGLDYGRLQLLHPLPKPVVVEEEEFDEED